MSEVIPQTPAAQQSLGAEIFNSPTAPRPRVQSDINATDHRPSYDRESLAEQHAFLPSEPKQFDEENLNQDLVESLILKCVMNLGSASGRRLAEQLKLPFGLLHELFISLRQRVLIVPKRDAAMNDYEWELSNDGFERAKRISQQCTYFGATPVTVEEYVESITLQSIRKTRPRFADLKAAYSDMILPFEMISQIGQALNAGRGLFLYGPPGNGKSSIGERVMDCVSEAIWIPRAIVIGREIVRLFDPTNHEVLPLNEDDKFAIKSKLDHRWIRIRRPTVIAGGELMLEHLDVTYNPVTGITEAPLQLKSNCGALVIDDLGRQRCSVNELLNRWIVPMEKGFDYISLPSGRQVKLPFDQLLVFATNLEPKELVDSAFLRRIPYKIEVADPREEEFRLLFERLAPEFTFEATADATEYLIEKHFKSAQRPLRYCYARDLLEQAKNYCEFHERPNVLTREVIDIAVRNYFAGL